MFSPLKARICEVRVSRVAWLVLRGFEAEFELAHGVYFYFCFLWFFGGELGGFGLIGSVQMLCVSR